QTPEGRSIVELFTQAFDGSSGRSRVGQAFQPDDGLRQAGKPDLLMDGIPPGARFVGFTAQTRMSGIDLPDGRSIRKGAPDSVLKQIRQQKGQVPDRCQEQVDAVASRGATPLLVCEGSRIAGLIVLEDILKPGMRDRFERLRRMGLRTVMVTGDNPLTAQAIAEQAGADGFIAQATA